jgi:AAA ATPase domain
VHAPRQTGKTTTLAALAAQLTADGRHVALRVSCERAEAWGDDIEAAELAVLDSIRSEAQAGRLSAELLPPDPWPGASPGSRLHAALQDWAAGCPLPLVLFFDEIDALRGRSLISVLRQLRDGFTLHPQAFPASVVLTLRRRARPAGGGRAEGLAPSEGRPAPSGPGPARWLSRPARPRHRHTDHLRPPPRRRPRR